MPTGEVCFSASFRCQNKFQAFVRRALAAHILNIGFCSEKATETTASHTLFRCLYKTADFILAIIKNASLVLSFLQPKNSFKFKKIFLQKNDCSYYRHHHKLHFFRCLVGETNFFSPCPKEQEQKEYFYTNEINAFINAIQLQSELPLPVLARFRYFFMKFVA